MAEIHVKNLIPSRATGSRSLVRLTGTAVGSLPRLNTVGRISTSSTDIVGVTFDHVVDWIRVWYDGEAYVYMNFDGDFSATADGSLPYFGGYEASPLFFPCHTKSIYFKPYGTGSTNIYYIANYKILETG